MKYCKEPLVTIALPCYNHEMFIQDAIHSLIKQSYKNIELIIIDDGSTDNSVNKIKELECLCKSRFTRFEFRHRPNKGLSTTLNEAIEWAKGDYWTTCSSDDFYHEDKIKSQVDFFLKNESYKFCITQAYVVSDINTVIESQTELYNSNLNSEITFDDIFTFKVHLPVTGMHLTEFLKLDLKGFDSNLSAEDFDINLKIVSRTPIGIVPEKLYFYRSPSAIGSSRKRRPMRLDVSESHLASINKFKGHPLYSLAINEWNYRRFIFFSAYSDTKLYAFKGMIKSLNKINEITFYKSLYKLLFIWKN